MTSIKPRTARVVIYQGDDLARLAELDDAVKRAERADNAVRRPLEAAVTQAERKLKAAERLAEAGGVRLLSQDDPAVEAREELKAAESARDEFVPHADVAKVERDEFAAEAESRGVTVVLIARPRLEWRALMREHKPREEAEFPEDYAFGPANFETLPPALLLASVDREMSPGIEGDLEEWLDQLADFDYYDRLFATAFALNRGSAAADPTLRLSSDSRTSAATSS